MNKRKSIFLSLCVLVVSLLYLWNQKTPVSPPALNDQKIMVSASFYPLAFITSQIAGERAEVRTITPAGAEPHDYEPTAQDMISMETSQIVILNGGKFEPWAEKITDDLIGKQVMLVYASQIVTNKKNGTTQQDPHIWLDPLLAQKIGEQITEKLIAVDPTHQSEYQSRAEHFNQRLLDLDTRYRQALAHCTQTDIVTSHAAFGYLAERYHLNQIAISGLSPDQEPSPSRMGEIARLVREKNIRYVFFERLVSPKLAETIALETGAQTLVLDPIEGLSDDQIHAGKNYFTQMEENARNLRLALSCT